MAIKNTETFKGIVVDNAHVRIETVLLLQDKTSMELVVQFRANEESPTFKGECFIAPYDIEGANPFAQGYTYLKSLPEFADATDSQ